MLEQRYFSTDTFSTSFNNNLFGSHGYKNNVDMTYNTKNVDISMLNP